jgi:hypothetical protein
VVGCPTATHEAATRQAAASVDHGIVCLSWILRDMRVPSESILARSSCYGMFT